MHGSLKRVINVASIPHRSPFRYPGGKTWLVPYVRQWLRKLSWKPVQFGEPFAGGGIVGLSVIFDELADRLTLVEIDQDVGSVWHTLLNGHGKALASKITEFQPTESSVRAVLGNKPESLFDRAFATVVRNRCQRGGIMAAGASLMKEGENGKGLASRWYAETLAKRIREISHRKGRITFLEGDGTEFIRQNASRRDMVFFIDPPYTVAGRRLYTHSDIDHKELFRVAASIEGDFLMTYDNAEPIRQLARQFHFDTHEVAMKNTHHEVMSELLIGWNLAWARSKLQFDNLLFIT
jgi:DNA adenine methylase